MNNKSADYDSKHPGNVRRDGSYIYEEFLATGGWLGQCCAVAGTTCGAVHVLLDVVLALCRALGQCKMLCSQHQ